MASDDGKHDGSSTDRCGRQPFCFVAGARGDDNMIIAWVSTHIRTPSTRSCSYPTGVPTVVVYPKGHMCGHFQKRD
jgi:hypothetical protein